jgi:amicyanin
MLTKATDRCGRKRVTLLVAAVALLATSLLVAGCGSSSTTTAAGGQTTTTGSATTAPPGGGAQVTIQNFAFSPASVTIKVGDTVTWTNKDSAAHTVTYDNGTTFASSSLATGATFSFTFTKAGTYPYHCGVHPNMKGTVVVQ